jgi:hypothetical protein
MILKCVLFANKDKFLVTGTTCESLRGSNEILLILRRFCVTQEVQCFLSDRYGDTTLTVSKLSRSSRYVVVTLLKPEMFLRSS